MPDTSNAQITIGGPLPRKAINALASAILADGAELHWDSPPDDGWVPYLLSSPEANEQLVLTGDQPWGKFERIEEFCQNHGLSYHRADDGHFSYGASNVTCRPEIPEGPVVLGGTIEDGPAIHLASFEVADMEEGNSAAKLLDFYRRAFAPIPPLTLIEE